MLGYFFSKHKHQGSTRMRSVTMRKDERWSG